MRDLKAWRNAISGRVGRAAWASLAAFALAILLAPSPRAEESVELAPRPGVHETLLVTVVNGAPAALLSFPGNNGVLSSVRNNFLLRTRGSFVAAGFSVGVLDAPSDHYGMDPAYRASAEHGQDVAAAVAYLADKAHAPVWLVGNSKGTISAANGAVRLGPARIAGIVLTSTVWSGGMSSVPVGEITTPVLLVHNRDDACPDSPFMAAGPGLESFVKAPAKDLIVVSSHDARSRPCEAMSPHGYLGIEDEVVGKISAWIKVHPRR